MLIVEVIRDRDHVFVESVVSCLVSSNQQDCRSLWIKGVEHPKRFSVALNTQFTHVAVSATVYPA